MNEFWQTHIITVLVKTENFHHPKNVSVCSLGWPNIPVCPGLRGSPLSFPFRVSLLSPVSGDHWSAFCHYKFSFFCYRISCEWNHMICFYCIWPLLFNVMFLRFIHVVDSIICLLHFMLNTQQFVYPFPCGWTFDLFLVFVCYEYSCYECLFTCIFAGMCLYFSSIKN